MPAPYTLATRAKMSVTGTPGTGTITLATAVSGWQTFAQAGLTTASYVIPYVIEDGVNWEVGYGTYTVAGTTLSRGPVYSSNGNAAISATSAAIVYVAPQATDMQAGTNAYNLVMLDGTAKMPAVDGSALLNLNGSNIASGTVPVARLPTGTAANQIVQLNASAQLPAVSAALLTNIPAGNVTGTLNASTLPPPGAASLGGVKSYTAVTHQFLTSVDTSGNHVSAQPSVNDLSGLGANVAFALSNGTNSAWGFPILDASARYPALDGSQITNLPSTSGPAFEGSLPNITPPSSTETQIIPTAVYDTASCYNGTTGAFTPNKSGYYLVSIGIQWTAEVVAWMNGLGGVVNAWRAAPGQHRGDIYKNGAYFGTNSCLVYLNAALGDYVQWFVWHNAANSQDPGIQVLGGSASAIWIRS